MQTESASQDTWGTSWMAPLCSIKSGASVGRNDMAGGNWNCWGLESPSGLFTQRLAPGLGWHPWKLFTSGLSKMPFLQSLAFLSASQSSMNKCYSKGGGGCMFLKTPTQKSQCHSRTTSVKAVTPNSSQSNSTNSTEFYPNSNGGDRDLSKNLKPCSKPTFDFSENGKLTQSV